MKYWDINNNAKILYHCIRSWCKPSKLQNGQTIKWLKSAIVQSRQEWKSTNWDSLTASLPTVAEIARHSSADILWNQAEQNIVNLINTGSNII